MRIRLFQSVSAVVVVAFCVTAAASPSDYTFTNVVNFTAAGLQISQPPIINNQGQVAFEAYDSKSIYIIRAQGSQQTVISHGGLLSSMNDHGVVVFSAGGMDLYPQGVYASDGVTTTTIVERLAGQSGYDFTFPGNPFINNDGTIVFGSIYKGQPGIFAAQNGQVTTLLFTPGAGLPLPQGLNDHGEVIFPSVRTSDNAQGLFSLNVQGGPVTPVVLNKDLGPNATIDGFSLNNQGRVAFVFQNTTVRGLATSDGTGITILTQAGSPIAGIALPYDDPSINDAGRVAFLAAYVQGNQIQTGIFTGSDPEVDRVIAGGDPLFGSTFAGLTIFDTSALNDKGQIAFYYQLADGQTGIAIATPVDVPEPSTTILFVTSTSLFVRRRR